MTVKSKKAPTLKSVLTGTGGVKSKFFQHFASLAALVKLLKEGGYRVVLTQGVFDMFHVGHLRYLQDARALGDILIVGVDSDELTRKMKGEDRPFDTFNDRIEILSGVSAVNVIARRHTDQHKYDLIKLVRPDVLVMSKTTRSFESEDKQALKRYCGRIAHLTARDAGSTTAKLLRLKTHGARDMATRISGAVQRELAGFLEGSNA